MAYEFINTRTGKVKTVYNVREAKQYDRLAHYQRVGEAEQTSDAEPEEAAEAQESGGFVKNVLGRFTSRDG